MRSFGIAALLFATLACHTAECAAQTYPTRPVKIMVGFNPGSSADILGRVYAQQLSARLGQQFIVENRAGASGNLAPQLVSRAEPDGYTLVMGSVANTISVSLLKDLKYNFAEDLAPIAAVADAPNVLAVSPSLGVSNVAEFIKMLKAKPGEVLYGSPGVGSAPHLAGELFNMMAGVKLMHIPYQGVPSSITDLLGGRISVVFGTAPAVAGYADDGRIKLLAVTSAKRSSLFANVPTMDESGLKGFDTSIWYGFFAPKNTPLGIRKQIADALILANEATEVRNALHASGSDPLTMTLDDFSAFVRADVEKWKHVVDAAQISPR